MLGKTERLDTNLTGQRSPCTITQLSFQESAGQRGSGQCGPSGYTSPGPNSGQVPLSSQSIVLLFGQDIRSQAE